ncbi:MAG: FTR1 family protein [Chloroflexi bacterium]|nr:FTR1 family protein [Chloroflexota bacterium]
MFQSLVITLREGLEAALIVGILVAYLSRIGNNRHLSKVWLGTGLAVMLSFAAGAIIFVAFGELEGSVEQLFEGTAMVLAVGVLSYMVIWMKRQAVNIKGELQARVDEALLSGSGFALASLAFLVVVREGIETVLFLFAATRTASPIETSVGGVIGLLVAVAIGYLVYASGTRLNLRSFFNVTGGLLILVAAGLLAHAVHEFEEAGLLPVIVEHVWDTGSVLSKEEGVGSFLRAVFGYNSNPSLSEVVAYVLYAVAAFWHFVAPAPLRHKSVIQPSVQS